jgi:hypothetical protein
MLPQSEIDAAEAYLAEEKQGSLTFDEIAAWTRAGKPMRHECACCNKFLGGDPESPVISAGFCSPLCPEAAALGWKLPETKQEKN